MNLRDVVMAINNTGFTNKQLDEISDAVKYARGQLGKRVGRSLTVGTMVKFTSNRNGRVYQGTLDALKIKNAIVTTPIGKFRVPMNMLEVV